MPKRNIVHDQPEFLQQFLVMSLRDAAQAAESVIPETERRIIALRAEADGLSERGAENLMFTVAIYDPWDNAGGPACSCKSTERGLVRAVRAAEREYTSRAGHLRTDDVLKYTVTAHTSELDVAVAADMWMPHSGQSEGAKREMS